MSDSHPNSLLVQALQEDRLCSAWDKVRRNDGVAGVDGVSIADFGDQLLSKLMSLRDAVTQQQYVPQPLREILIHRPGKKPRRLAVPTVRDRVLQTAIAMALTPVLDRQFEDVSYGYRAGRSVPMAVARVAHYRDQGYRWVVDADIQSFFDNIPHDALLSQLQQALPDCSTLPLIQLWLASTLKPAEGQPYLLDKGVPQGSPLSPLLSNLYLDTLDEAIIAADMRLVRFADDFIILCKGQQDAEAALELTETTVTSLELKLSREKTRITSFEEGFTFLGVEFFRNLMQAKDPAAAPWVLPPDPSLATYATPKRHNHIPKAEPATLVEMVPPASRTYSEPPQRPAETDMGEDEHIALIEQEEYPPLLRSLMVETHGCRITKEGERIVVSKASDVLISVPAGKLDQISVTSNVMISSALLRYCAEAGIHVWFGNQFGIAQAGLDPIQPANVDLLRGQVLRLQQTDWALMLAAGHIEGKLSGQRLLLQRLNRRRNIEVLHQAAHDITRQLAQLVNVSQIDSLRGHEGQAAKIYFQAISELIGPDWLFGKRNRQPPEDPFNAMLSYGYTVLYQNVLGLIRRRGLHPYLGSLHQPNGRHAALASDLMEEFRAAIVDYTAIQCVLSGEIQIADFRYDDPELPCKLQSAARKRYAAHLEKRFRTGLVHPRLGINMDYRRAIQYQIYHYAQVVAGEESAYLSFKQR